MRLFLLLSWFALLIPLSAAAQTVQDSIISPDSVLPPGNTGVRNTAGSLADPDVQQTGYIHYPAQQPVMSLQRMLGRHPYFYCNTPPAIVSSHLKVFKGKEALFYVLCGLVLIFSLMRLAFVKYFNDLFRVFFRTTLKQRQIKEQLVQSPFPSFIFNIFFIAVAGLYLDFLLGYFQVTAIRNFWLLYAYCSAGLTVIYFIKFICLKLCGWLFNLRHAADAYIFIVFIINKVIGIFLLPVVIVLTFWDEPVSRVAFVLSWCGIAALLLYRFILGYAAIRKEVRFNLFHFFLYLCAFEIAPLLLIYKLLLLIF